MILENKIYDVIRTMTPTLNTTQLQSLKDTLFAVFENCEIVDKSEHTELAVVNDSWKYNLQDFLTSKTLEGKTDEYSRKGCRYKEITSTQNASYFYYKCRK